MDDGGSTIPQTRAVVSRSNEYFGHTTNVHLGTASTVVILETVQVRTVRKECFFVDVDSVSVEEAAEAGISRLSGWMRGIGMNLSLPGVGMGRKRFEEMAGTTIRIYGHREDHIANAHMLRRGHLSA